MVITTFYLFLLNGEFTYILLTAHYGLSTYSELAMPYLIYLFHSERRGFHSYARDRILTICRAFTLYSKGNFMALHAFIRIRNTYMITI